MSADPTRRLFPAPGGPLVLDADYLEELFDAEQARIRRQAEQLAYWAAVPAPRAGD